MGVLTGPMDFINFLTASPSSYYAAHTGAHLLHQAGFTHHAETDPWDAQPGGHYLIRGGALIAWHIGAPPAPGPMNINRPAAAATTKIAL